MMLPTPVGDTQTSPSGEANNQPVEVEQLSEGTASFPLTVGLSLTNSSALFAKHLLLFYF